MSDLALRIFDAFIVFPEFNKMVQDSLLDRELLKDAAFLLEAGKFISFSSYHRHSYYLITESSLLGFTQEEKHIIALTNRFARKSPAKPSKNESFAYLEGNITRINLLSSCLRIARCLLRTRQPKIKGFKLSGKNNSYTMQIHFHPRVRIEAEKIAIKKEIRNLEKALDCTLEAQLFQDEETSK
jgi:exopolyphosphatase/guanosine-5'-triphosphate,3'-diphosphate pyrophosphatase